MLSKKVKIKLDSNQELIVNTLSNEHRLLYNHLLDSIRIKSKTFKELNELYKNFRINNNLTISSKSAQNTCINLINNIKSFYALYKKDKTVKFPYKFKSHKYFTSFTYDSNGGQGGFRIDKNQIIFNLLSSSKDSKKLIIDLPQYCNDINMNNVKTVTIKKENDDYFIIFVYQEESNINKLNKKNFISIDLGYSELVTAYSNKIDNFSVNNLKLKKLQKRIEHLQSLKDKKKKGSNKFNKINKRFKKVKSKQVNKVKDFQHKVSTLIVNKCKSNDIGSIIIGDIQVKKILNSDNRKLSGISKSTLSLSRFKTLLEYKSNKEGIDFYLINEAYTSQQNCLTGEIMFSSDLSKRIVEISKGKFIDRDLNSAINIAKKCKVVWLDHFPNFNLDKMYLNNYSGKLSNIKF